MRLRPVVVMMLRLELASAEAAQKRTQEEGWGEKAESKMKTTAERWAHS